MGIYIAGKFKVIALFENSDKTIFMEKNAIGNKGNYFVSKLNTNGRFQWVTVIEADQKIASTLSSISIDANENIYFSSTFTQTAKFYSVLGSSMIEKTGSNTSDDIFVAKYSKTGVIQSVQQAGGPQNDLVYDSEVDENGNLYLVGAFGCCYEDFTYFGNITIKNKGAFGGYLAKLSSTGVWLWVNYMGEPGNEAIYQIEIDQKEKTIYTLGYATNFTILNSQPAQPGLSLTLNNADVIFTKFNYSGNLIWAKKIGGLGNDLASALCRIKNGNALISGYFTGSLPLDSGQLVSQNFQSGFLAEINSLSGKIITAKLIGSQGGWVQPNRLAASPVGNIYLGGSFSKDIYIDQLSKNSSKNSNLFISNFDFEETPTLQKVSCRDSIKITVNNKTLGNFHWFRNDTFVTITSKPELYTKSLGEYYVVYHKDCFRPDTSEKISIKQLDLIVDLPKSLTVCKGDSVTLSVQSNASKFLWRPTGIFNNDTLQNPSLKAQVTRYLYLTSSLDNCHQKDSLLLNVTNIKLLVQPISPIKRGQSIQLFASGAELYTWSPNQFISDTSINNPMVNPPETKLYRVTGTTNNCTTSDSVLVIVVEAEDILLPTAFTPQGDGLNETFAPAIVGSFDYIQLSIYSRWGELIHQTNYPAENNWWDGTYKNVACQGGVYSYSLEAKSIFGKVYQKSGTVTLLR